MMAFFIALFAIVLRKVNLALANIKKPFMIMKTLSHRITYT